MSNIADYSNEQIIKRYLKRYNHSEQSMRMRKSSLTAFFQYYDGDIKDISKSDLIDYFDYLNHKNDYTLQTKKNKFGILKSFLNFCLEYYDGFSIIIPKYSIKWSKNHKEPETNKDIVMEKEEVLKILDYLRLTHYKYYLIFKVLVDTGMRKGEVINIEYDNVNTEKRFIKTLGKTGYKVYYISKDLAEELKMFINERKKKNIESKNLFVSNRFKEYSNRRFNAYLKEVLKKIGIDKNITCHTFRRTLNTLRKRMGCSNEDRKILLNHKTGDVNIEHYLKLNYKDYIKLYDRYYPY